MSRIEDNNRLLSSVKQQINALIEEMGATRAEGSGDYADLITKGQKIFKRMENMQTLGDVDSLKNIMAMYDRAIAVINKELQAVKTNQAREGYTAEDVKGLEDLVRVAKSSQIEGKVGQEWLAVQEYSKRQGKENKLFSERAVREIEEKIDNERKEIKEAESPINDVLEQLKNDGNKLILAEGIKKIEAEIATLETELATMKSTLAGNGLTNEQIEQDANYIAKKEELENRKKTFNEKSVKYFAECKNVNKEGKSQEQYYNELKLALDGAYNTAKANVRGILDSNASKNVHVTKTTVDSNGKENITLEDKTIEELTTGLSELEALKKLNSEKGKITNYIRTKDEKILEYKNEAKMYSDEIEQNSKGNALVPAEKTRFRERVEFLRNSGKGGIKAFFGAFRRKNVEKQMAEVAERDKKGYYKSFHSKFEDEIKRGADRRDARQAAQGRVDNERFSTFKKNKKAAQQNLNDRDDR